MVAMILICFIHLEEILEERIHDSKGKGYIQKTKSPKWWRGRGERGTLNYCGWLCKLVRPLWNCMEFLDKLKTELPYDQLYYFCVHTRRTLGHDSLRSGPRLLAHQDVEF